MTSANPKVNLNHSIPVFQPFCGEEEIAAVTAVLKSGWWGNGAVCLQFERELAEFVGAKHAISTNSATAALHLSLIVAGVGVGDEVLTTSLTFVSTNHVILYVGATPVFADVDPETLCIDPDDVERKITPQTKAIMAVDFGGHPVAVQRLRAIAAAYNLIVIEDAAHSAGAEWRGHRVGSLFPLTCLSLHPVKGIASPDGGVITTDNDEWAARLRHLRWMGINKDTFARVGADASQYAWQYDVDELGYKCHFNDIGAAIALCQLHRLTETNTRREQIAARYEDGLSDLEWLSLPAEYDYVRHAWHLYVVRLDERDALAAHLRERGIATGMHYVPNHLHAVYAQYRTELPVVEREWLRLLTLPLYPAMTDDDVDYVIEAIRDFRI